MSHDTDSKSVVLLSGDLIFSSRVKAAAEANDFRFQVASSITDQASAAWVILDLATCSGSIDGLMDQCATVCPSARVLAFGPHVQAAKLDKAKQAGIPTVVTRGQFDRSLPTLFQT